MREAFFELVPLIVDLENNSLLRPDDWPGHLHVEIGLAGANWDRGGCRWVCRAYGAINEAVFGFSALRDGAERC